jgi:hypothetical protein
MTALRSRRTGAVAGPVAAALAQTLAGTAAHGAASGCLPTGPALALALPAAVVAVLLLGALLGRRPLLLLAGGQLAVHGVLALTACAGGHRSSPVLLTFAHVAALVLCRAVLGRVVRSAEHAAASLTRLVRRPALAPVLHLPVLRRPATAAPCAVLRAVDLLGAAPRRGPPPGLPAPA